MNALLMATVAAALAVTLTRPDAPDTEVALWTAPTTAAPTAVPDPVQMYRARRRDTRVQDQAALTALAETEDADPEARRLARAMLIETSENDEIELAVEAALAAQGMSDALCVARRGGVTVLLSGQLTERQAALILDIARQASGQDVENIRVAGF